MASPSLQSLVEQFVADLTTLTKRMALEQVLESLGGSASAAPARRGPGRPPKAASAKPAVAQKKAGGKRSAEDLSAFSDSLLAHVQANPGQRGEQIAAALGTDVGTMRLPMKKLIAEKKVRTEGQRRGMTYFAGGGRAKAAPKQKRVGGKRGSKGKASKKRPAATVEIRPRPRPDVPVKAKAEAEFVPF